jgi:hypothetical protein
MLLSTRLVSSAFLARHAGVAMFSEDFDLLPKGLFTELLNDCADGTSSYDLLGSLFEQMNSSRIYVTASGVHRNQFRVSASKQFRRSG